MWAYMRRYHCERILPPDAFTPFSMAKVWKCTEASENKSSPENFMTTFGILIYTLDSVFVGFFSIMRLVLSIYDLHAAKIDSIFMIFCSKYLGNEKPSLWLHVRSHWKGVFQYMTFFSVAAAIKRFYEHSILICWLFLSWVYCIRI